MDEGPGRLRLFRLYDDVAAAPDTAPAAAKPSGSARWTTRPVSRER
ncbi:hypothetical protein [Streptomyces sp. 2132.2]|nr:hypothetical protein [Streptomyces sp. 2132.2]